MSDELLPHYQRELAAIRRLAGEFADTNPNIAGRLRVSADACEDPHVERMIQAFAYLNARIRHKLDDEFPEITDAMLGVLYPHYLAPIPSMAIVELHLNRDQTDRTTPYVVPAGEAIETAPVRGEVCEFRTGYDVNLLPISVQRAVISPLPFTTQRSALPAGASAMLQLTLRTWSPQVSFSQLELGALRFYLKGQAQHVYSLYELLFSHVLDIAIDRGRQSPVSLGKGALKPVGFDDAHALLPYPERSFPGYRLLSEYFAFPEKFLFVDLAGLTPEATAGVGSELTLTFYLDHTTPDLERNVQKDMFRLGCTPIINLFKQRAEPIRLTQTEHQYRIAPDARRPLATEVYSVDRVTAVSPRHEEVEYLPFYAYRHAREQTDQRTFYYASRQPGADARSRTGGGTEVHLSFVDLDFSPAAAPHWMVDVETTCLNRDLPRHLPFGGDQPKMRVAGGGLVTRVECLTAPTPTLRSPLGRSSVWRAISHLNLNHISLTDADGSPDALREILMMYDFTGSADTQSQIVGITSVKGHRSVTRLGVGPTSGFARGVDVHIEFDESRFANHGLYLFASVIERFLGLYCSINAFTQLTARTQQREGIWIQWPPRAAQKILL